MKTKVPLLLAGICLSLTAFAADEAPTPAGHPTDLTSSADDLSKFKTADELWDHITELRKEPDVQPTSQDELVAIGKAFFGKQRAAASAFLEAYPNDARRYAARLIVIKAEIQLAQLPGAAPSKTSPEEVLKQIDEILKSDAPEDTKGEAAFVQIMIKASDIDPSKAGMIADFIKSSSDFLTKYPQHRLAPQMKLTQLQVAAGAMTPEAEALLTSFASDKDPDISGAAKEVIAKRQRIKDLKSKPLDLKFTAVDEKEIDLANLRGKVVLVDFWASWCGPCMAEVPNLVETYKKLHDKGFEIVGLSQDDDKSMMEEAIKKNGITWAQCFDGGAGVNRIAAKFGVESLPTMWLLDKKGMVREVQFEGTGLKGEQLGAAVEKLLAE